MLAHEEESLRLLTVVLDSDGGGTLDLAGGTFFVVLAVTEPLTELKTAVNLDEGNVVHLGESVNKLGVLGVFAVGSEDAKYGLLAVNALAHFVKALNDT